MNKIDQKRENEKRILKVMIDIYQRKHPQESNMCEDLYKYACLRIDKCPFMETKTFCTITIETGISGTHKSKISATFKDIKPTTINKVSGANMA